MLPEDRFLTCAQLAEMLGVTRKTIYAWSRSGTLPRPRKLGKRLSRWLWAEVEECLERMPVRFRRRA